MSMEDVRTVRHLEHLCREVCEVSYGIYTLVFHSLDSTSLMQWYETK
jgi:hypothetical protein